MAYVEDLSVYVHRHDLGSLFKRLQLFCGGTQFLVRRDKCHMYQRSQAHADGQTKTLKILEQPVFMRAKKSRNDCQNSQGIESILQSTDVIKNKSKNYEHLCNSKTATYNAAPKNLQTSAC